VSKKKREEHEREGMASAGLAGQSIGTRCESHFARCSQSALQYLVLLHQQNIGPSPSRKMWNISHIISSSISSYGARGMRVGRGLQKVAYTQNQ